MIPSLASVVEGEHGKKHESHLGDAGIGQHPFYALLENSRDIADKQGNGRDDGNKNLPLALHIPEAS